jgi:hypothetical protein
MKLTCRQTKVLVRHHGIAVETSQYALSLICMAIGALTMILSRLQVAGIRIYKSGGGSCKDEHETSP